MSPVGSFSLRAPVWGVALGLALLAPTGCGDGEELPPLGCVVPIGDSPSRGPSDAWATLVEFADFLCPYCVSATPVIDELLERRPRLRHVFKHFPVHGSPAVTAAVAAECAGQQDAFWPIYELMFVNSPYLGDKSLLGFATEIGLDVELWQACIADEQSLARVQADADLAWSIGVYGTPSFFLNGHAMLGLPPLDTLVEWVDAVEVRAESSGIAAADYYASIEGQGCPEGISWDFPRSAHWPSLVNPCLRLECI